MSASQPTPAERDERVALPLDPETALRALLKVDPDSEPPTTTDDDGQPLPAASQKSNDA